MEKKKKFECSNTARVKCGQTNSAKYATYLFFCADFVHLLFSDLLRQCRMRIRQWTGIRLIFKKNERRRSSLQITAHVISLSRLRYILFVLYIFLISSRSPPTAEEKKPMNHSNYSCEKSSANLLNFFSVWPILSDLMLLEYLGKRCSQDWNDFKIKPSKLQLCIFCYWST